MDAGPRGVNGKPTIGTPGETRPGLARLGVPTGGRPDTGARDLGLSGETSESPLSSSDGCPALVRGRLFPEVGDGQVERSRDLPRVV